MELILQKRQTFLPIAGVRLERVAIVFEPPDDDREIADNGLSGAMQRAQVTIKVNRMDGLGPRRCAWGEGIEVRLQHDDLLRQVGPPLGLFETTIRAPRRRLQVGANVTSRRRRRAARSSIPD